MLNYCSEIGLICVFKRWLLVAGGEGRTEVRGYQSGSDSFILLALHQLLHGKSLYLILSSFSLLVPKTLLPLAGFSSIFRMYHMSFKLLF